MTALSVSITRKVFPNGVCTIEDLQFSAKKGEFVAIVGPSGTGKTTLLNIISGIDKQVEGEVRLNGESRLQGVSDKADVGFMFQDARLMPWLTVKQNIRLVLNEGVDIDSSRMDTLLEKVGLKDFADTYPGQLSGGMKRRVSLVRAFINHPQLLLMDEPFQSLDEPTANTLRQMLLDLWKETKPTVLFVTHSLREALAVADRVLFLSSRPSCVIMDYAVNIPRPRQLEDVAINTLHAELLSQHPDLLSGSLTGDVVKTKELNDG